MAQHLPDDARSVRRSQPRRDDPGAVAFVLTGGASHGAVQVGMLEALMDAGIQPDLVVGTSVGALNGVAFAADPTPGGRRDWPTVGGGPNAPTYSRFGLPVFSLARLGVATIFSTMEGWPP